MGIQRLGDVWEGSDECLVGVCEGSGRCLGVSQKLSGGCLVEVCEGSVGVWWGSSGCLVGV